MTDRLRERVRDQFSYRGDRADIWRGFDHLLDTGAFLNLGYSEWYQPHVFGSPQLRLATVVGRALARRNSPGGDRRLLDVGCGRGGPTVHLAEHFGFDAVGVDLVPYNVEAATRNARDRDDVSFVLGDATALPFGADTFGAWTALDSVVYAPDKRAVYENAARVLRPGGVVGVSDLLVASDVDAAGREAVRAFADAWDMPRLVSVDEYRETVERAGLTVERVRDISAHSVGRFRKWTRLYLALADRPGGLLARLLDRWGLDADAVTTQVRTAHDALPYLRHVTVVAVG